MSATLSRFEHGNFQEVLTVGAVSTFAYGWLIDRLSDFSKLFPDVDVRLKTNNNRADFLEDGLDYFVRFGDGAWHSTNALQLMNAPLSPVCAPLMAEALKTPSDLKAVPLLRSYRLDEWNRWFEAVNVEPPSIRGWMFDSSVTMAAAAAKDAGVALVPVTMFREELEVKSLEAILGVSLFDRLPRGVVLTDEGQTLLPVLSDAFGRMSATLSRFEHGNFQEVLTVGAVSTFAYGWLIDRLSDFSKLFPDVDVRLKTNNNRADFLEDGLDYFVRFGDGAWHSTNALQLMN
ncbi:HTH-type transcriptional activator AmpR, partial [Durusdinium trenchii]